MALPARIEDYLTREELAGLLQRSDLKAGLILAANYALIAGAFAIAILWPNPLTILLGILLLGARQLGLGILNHDCAHSVFFRSRRANEILGHWLCGGPVNSSLYAYRDYHLKHHRFAGTEQDPDLAMAMAYPASRASMKRKLLRDASGRTGLRDTGRLLKTLHPVRNAPFLLAHLVLITVLTAAGAPWAYLMWWAAKLFVYPLVTRIRFMAEHGVARDRLAPDTRDNTCTTLTRWWERIFIAPNHVNYHVEHHLLAGVPLYNLRRFHRLLLQRGFYEGYDCLSHGYPDVIRKATRPDASGPSQAPSAA